MDITVPKHNNECSLCKDDVSFYGEKHNLTDCFTYLRERVEALESVNLTLLRRVSILESVNLTLLRRVSILESAEARNRNA